MKIHAIARRKAAPAGSARSVLAGAALVSALLLAGPANRAGADNLMSGGGDGDSVGSLPLTGGGGTPPGVHRLSPLPAEQFRTTLVGNEAQIRKAILDVKGQYELQVQPLDAHGTVRLSYQGDVEIVLDRALLASSFVSVEVELGGAFHGGLGRVRAGSRSALQVLHAGRFDLHLQQLARSGLVDSGVSLIAMTPQRSHASRLEASAGANWIVLKQTH